MSEDKTFPLFGVGDRVNVQGLSADDNPGTVTRSTYIDEGVACVDVHWDDHERTVRGLAAGDLYLIKAAADSEDTDDEDGYKPGDVAEAVHRETTYPRLPVGSVVRVGYTNSAVFVKVQLDRWKRAGYKTDYLTEDIQWPATVLYVGEGESCE